MSLKAVSYHHACYLKIYIFKKLKDGGSWTGDTGTGEEEWNTELNRCGLSKSPYFIHRCENHQILFHTVLSEC